MDTVSVLTAERKLAVGRFSFLFGQADFHIAERLFRVTGDFQHISLRQADTVVIASPVYFYGISAQMKTLVDRLHTPMRNNFGIRRLGLILAGAATLPDLFDPILLQYRMILRFFDLEDIGTVLVSGVREKGDVRNGDGIRQAYELGNHLE